MLRNVITLAFNVALALYLFRGRCFDTRSLFCFSLLSFRFFIGGRRREQRRKMLRIQMGRIDDDPIVCMNRCCLMCGLDAGQPPVYNYHLNIFTNQHRSYQHHASTFQRSFHLIIIGLPRSGFHVDARLVKLISGHSN